MEGFNSRSPEIDALLPIARLQSSRSRIPSTAQTLIETCRTAKGIMARVHLGRLERQRRAGASGGLSSVAAASEHDCCLGDQLRLRVVSTEPLGSDREIGQALTTLDGLEEDIHASQNFPELARRAFREIARVAGLIYQGTPSARKTARHLQNERLAAVRCVSTV